MFKTGISTKKKMLSAAVAIGLTMTLTSTVAPAQAAKTNLVVGSTQGIPQLNPITRTFAYDETLYPLLWSALSKWKPDGTVGPNLAQSWKMNKTATQWTFNLRKALVFSDGTAIDGKAVKAVVDYVLDPKTVTQERNNVKMITKVSVKKLPSGDQVIFDLKTPNALLPEAMAGIKIIKVSEVANFNVKPSSSGPFMVKTFSPNVSLSIVRNPKYFGSASKLTDIKFVKLSDPTAAVTALRSGNIDVMYELPLPSAGPLLKNRKLQLIRAKVSTMAVTWEYDLTSAPFNNLKARQAVAYATNRAAILKAAYYGYGSVSSLNTIVPDNSIWQCGTAGGLTKYTFDLQKAKALFAEAGVTEFTWWSVSGALPEFDAMGQVLQADLKTIGINMKIVSSEVGTWAAKFYPAGLTYPGILLPNYQSVPAEPGFSMNFLLSGRAESNWNSTAYDNLFTKAIGTLDTAQRKKVWCDAMKLENQELPLITPFVFSVLHAAQSNVKGAWVEGGGQLHLESVHIK